MDYKQLLHDRHAFRSAGGTTSTDFNLLDMPGHLYFKVFFHFNNGDADLGHTNGGLLALPDTDIPLIYPINNTNYDTQDMKDKLRLQSSAWSYLILNGEDERAWLLQYFIYTLLNITSESPWYFQKITGLDAALERKSVMEREIKFEELRLKITLTCLPDAIDDRIGTLLDLYRSIVFSWSLKKEIVPANLRKFDMSIYIFQSPITEIYNTFFAKDGDKLRIAGKPLKHLNKWLKRDAEDANINPGFAKNIDNLSNPTISYKYIELHNCEIDYSSSKNGYAELNNIEGNNPEYAIDILFDDIYESRYNLWAAVKMGDFLNADITSDLYTPGLVENSIQWALDIINNQILGNWPSDDRFNIKNIIENTKDQLLSLGNKMVGNIINRINLGNLYTISLSNMEDKVKSFTEGNILNSVRNATNIVRRFDNNASKKGVSGNLYDKNKETVDITKLNKLGNLYLAKSALLNI